VSDPIYKALLAALAVWRLTHLLSAEDGPWKIFSRLRRAVDGSGWATLLDCFYCLSMWIAAPFAVWIGIDWPDRFLLWLALSAAAILLERVTARKEVATPAAYFEHDA
jgi:hypothetical protein